MSLLETATGNLSALMYNEYPGRGIVVGQTQNGQTLVLIAWMMARSGPNKNRRYERDGDSIRTIPADPSQPIPNPELTLYDAIRSKGNVHAVSNGRQTGALFDKRYGTFQDAMAAYSYEPDASHTSRITAVTSRGVPYVGMHQHYKSPVSDVCLSTTWRLEFPPGFGYCLHTYAGDGNPLPRFTGEPRLVPIGMTENPSIRSISDMFWKSLNTYHRIAIATKFIDIATGEVQVDIINQF